MLEKKPFTTYTLDEKREEDEREIISISLNKQERAWLDGIKEELSIKSDSRALKQIAKVGINVLHSTFSGDLWQAFFKKKKEKPPKTRDGHKFL